MSQRDRNITTLTMPSLLTNLIFLAVPLVLLLLTGIAGYAYSQIRFLSLPISEALALLTVVLPLITGISTQGVSGLIKRSSQNEQYQLTIPLIAVIGFQLIYETVIATLALTYIIPPSSLDCSLARRWLELYRVRDTDGIRAIQDSFTCCGFRTVTDMAFPWGEPSSCPTTFERNKSCLGPWRQAQQKNAGMLLLVAITVFIVKVLSILALLTSTWTQPRWMQRFQRSLDGDAEEPEEDRRSSMRRLIENNPADEGYRDDAEEDSNPRALGASDGDDHDQGPRVEPSPLMEHSNEWRDQGANSGT